MGRFFKSLESDGTAREIDKELRFHLELLTQEHLQLDMSVEEAKEAAIRRFGNVERIKDQCLAILKRAHPFLVALKFFLILIFLAGVVIRILSMDQNTRHLGDLLIAVPVLSRLFLYVRSLTPSSFLSKHETPSPLRLNESVQPLFTPYDQGMLTPVERLISDK
ncbi:hypothetical protein BH18ACI4_BH18ACI4_13240 [soil metagenome]